MTRLFAMANLVGIISSSAYAYATPSFLHPIFCTSRGTSGRHSSTAIRSLPADFSRDAASIVLPSVAAVSPVGVRNMTSRGTGFVVDFPTEDTNDRKRVIHLLTAAHVASPGSRLSVSFSPGLKLPALPATLVDRDLTSDLALIRVEIDSDAKTTVPNPLKFYVSSIEQNGSPDIGTLAFACGYPSGMDGAAFTMGIVCGTARGLEGVSPWLDRAPSRQQRQIGNASSVDESDISALEDSDGQDDVMFRNVSFVVTDASMAPGMSGGPLANANGEVMGMCALVRPDLRALGNYAVSGFTCQEFLKKLMTKVRPDGDTLDKRGYRVVLFNDRMNKKERVAKILRNVAEMDGKSANSVMMAAHLTGRGIIKEFKMNAQGNEDAGDALSLAEELCECMRKEDVLVEVEEIFD
ncbi:hypothetical protein ACHAWF_003116 [Thalassiosira exigua]